MSTTPFYFLFTIFAVVAKVSSLPEDYFWRDYDGTIPKDAVVGGEAAGLRIYIGQAYIRNLGFIVVEIKPGAREVAAAIHGVKRADKILCGPQDSFEWIPATSADLHYVLLDERPVIGGHEDDQGYLHVGRIASGDGTRIGKVNAFEIGNANLWIPDQENEKYYVKYEVLCYVDNGTGLDVRKGSSAHFDVDFNVKNL